MKRKNVTITIISIMILLIAGILIYLLFLNNIRGIEFLPDENSKYIPINDGSFLELSENGAITRYDYDGTVEKVLLESDIIEIANGERKEDGNLIIHKDGTIGLSREDCSSEIMLGIVENAQTGVITSEAILVITEQGEVYEYLLPLSDRDELDENLVQSIQFTKVSELNYIKEISADRYNVAVLTEDGNVWVKGEIAGTQTEKFLPYKTENPIVRIGCMADGVIALDNEGNMYELGVSIYDVVFMPTYDEFTLIPEYRPVTKFVVDGTAVLVQNKKEEIYYFGEKYVGKASGIEAKGKISVRNNIRDFYINDEYIFLLSDKGMYIKKWDKLR